MLSLSELFWSVQTARMKCLHTWMMVLHNALDVVLYYNKNHKYSLKRPKKCRRKNKEDFISSDLSVQHIA